MHMLGLSGTKTAIFFNKNSNKFKPLNNEKIKVYCSSTNKTKKIENLSSDDIIHFIKDFIY